MRELERIGGGQDCRRKCWKCQKWTDVGLGPSQSHDACLAQHDRVQSRCYSLLETWCSYKHKRFVSASLWFLNWSNNNLWGHVRIEIPYPALFPLRIPHPNPIKTRNTAPAHNFTSRFPPLFSAQIPNITAKKSQILHPAKPTGDPLCMGNLLSLHGLQRFGVTEIHSIPTWQ